MSVTLLAPAPSGPVAAAPRRIAPIWRAAQTAAHLVARPAMVRDEVSATRAAGIRLEKPSPASVVRLAAIAAGAAFAGSTVGLAFFLSRRPTGSPGDHYAKFRA